MSLPDSSIEKSESAVKEKLKTGDEVVLDSPGIRKVLIDASGHPMRLHHNFKACSFYEGR